MKILDPAKLRTEKKQRTLSLFWGDNCSLAFKLITDMDLDQYRVIKGSMQCSKYCFPTVLHAYEVKSLGKHFSFGHDF